MHHGLKSIGIKATAKIKKPLLKPYYKRARMDFAEQYLHWTFEDWKRVIWLDKTKINRFGSDVRQWAGKKKGKSLSNRLV